MGIKISDKDLIDDLIRVYNMHNKIPYVTVYVIDGKYNRSTYARRFGSWNKALLLCFGKVNEEKGPPPLTIECGWCGEKTKNPKFCSSSCSALFSQKQNKKDPHKCLNCHKDLISNSRKYCSLDCKTAYHHNEYIYRWLHGLEDGVKGKDEVSDHIRKYLIEQYGEKCQKCGWNEKNPHTRKIPLHIHHKNGDWSNNSKDNLEILCPSCHSLTGTYGGRNKGKGRRSKYGYRPYVDFKKHEEFDKCPVCGKEKNKKLKFCSPSCLHTSQKRFDIKKEELEILIGEKSYSEIGRMFGVTCNSIKKRCKRLGIEFKKK